MQKENRKDILCRCVGQAMPDNKRNSSWENKTRSITRQAEPDLRVTTTKAFTLIELLVVVLIIGILAAVALPQYNKAVLKSRYVQMIAFARPTYTAWTAHYIANGEYTDNWDELAIDLPGQLTNWNAVGDTIRKGNYKCILSDGEHADHIIRLSCVYTDVHGNEIRYTMYPNGRVQCQTQTNWTSGMEVCKSLGGKLRSTDTSWMAYDLSSPS